MPAAALIASAAGAVLALNGVTAAAWGLLGAGAALAAVAVATSVAGRWSWAAALATVVLGVLVGLGWIAPSPSVAGTVDDPVRFGTPGLVTSRGNSLEETTTWEITLTDVYEGESVIPTLDGDAEGTCWFVVGLLRPVDGIVPASPPTAWGLTFDDGSTTLERNDCIRDPEGPQAGEYYSWLYSHSTLPERAVTFSIGYATLNSGVEPVLLEFSDTQPGRAAFEVITPETG